MEAHSPKKTEEFQFWHLAICLESPSTHHKYLLSIYGVPVYSGYIGYNVVLQPRHK